MIDWHDVERRLVGRGRRTWNEQDLAAYEKRVGVRLPDALRRLYLHVGEGDGLLPLDYEAEARRHALGWGRDPDADVASLGHLDRPFPHSDAWNLEADDPDDLGLELETELARRYWAPLDGAFPIADLSDVQDTLVVVTGEARGTVWRDARISCGGLLPWRAIDRSRMSIDIWGELLVQTLLSGGSMLAWRPRANVSGRRGDT